MSRKAAFLTAVLILSACFCTSLTAEDIPLTTGIYFNVEETQQRTLKKGDFLRVMCEHDLRDEQGFDKPVLYSTYNHEGGMKFRIIEVGSREEHDGVSGVWLHISLTAPIYVTTGGYINRGTRYWFWLPDDQQIFDYEG